MDKDNKDPTIPDSGTEEQPEVYVVSQGKEGVHFTRREFIEVAGVATAGAVLISTVGGQVQNVQAQSASRTPSPTPTRTPSRTPTPRPCTIRTDRDDVSVHVGPGRNRGIRLFMPQDEDILVIGQGEDRDGNLWWQIELPKIEQAWVADEDVTTRGDCLEVGVSPTPPIVTSAPRETSTVGPVPPTGEPGAPPAEVEASTYTVRGVTRWLPCGSPIPAGATCICNCVAPSCTCVGNCGCDGVCSCAGNNCSCNTVHYWYPN